MVSSEYQKEYWIKNKARLTKKRKLYKIKWNKDNYSDRLEYNEAYRKSHPWYTTMHAINMRVRDSEYYIRNNIKNNLKMSDLKYLWLRDRAGEMAKPNIHRMNNKLGYTRNNCQYIEELDHWRIHRG